MATDTSKQIEAIHSMLTSGQRSIRIERHTLVLWGLTAAFLCLLTPLLFTTELFPILWQRAVAEFTFLALVLGTVATIDFTSTQRLRRRRNESLSFVQRQITKVWWSLIGLGLLVTLGMHFFGGGYMVFGVWMILFGLALFIHGLFSQQMLQWSGIMVVILGLSAVFLMVPFEVTRWLASSVFGIGMPVLSFMLEPKKNQAMTKRLMISAVWLAVVLSPVVASYYIVRQYSVPGGDTVSLAAFRQQLQVPTQQIVSLPAGTVLPIQIKLKGDVFEQENVAVVPVTLTKALQIVLRDGEPNGHFRVAQGDWKQRMYNFWVRNLKLEASLTPTEGPIASAAMEISTE